MLRLLRVIACGLTEHDYDTVAIWFTDAGEQHRKECANCGHSKME